MFLDDLLLVTVRMQSRFWLGAGSLCRYTNAMTTAIHKKKLLLLFGGESQEHDVSIVSAQNIYNAINLDRIEPVLCYIDRDGAWWHVAAIAKQPKQIAAVTPILGAAMVQIGDAKIPIDVIFPVLHGTHGEDGTVQGLAALMHTPIVGCGVAGSAVCIDKVLTKQLLAAADVPIVPFATHHQGEKLPDFAVVSQQLGKVLFVKPARQGSSVGVSLSLIHI